MHIKVEIKRVDDLITLANLGFIESEYIGDGKVRFSTDEVDDDPESNKSMEEQGPFTVRQLMYMDQEIIRLRKLLHKNGINYDDPDLPERKSGREFMKESFEHHIARCRSSDVKSGITNFNN